MKRTTRIASRPSPYQMTRFSAAGGYDLHSPEASTGVNEYLATSINPAFHPSAPMPQVAAVALLPKTVNYSQIAAMPPAQVGGTSISGLIVFPAESPKPGLQVFTAVDDGTFEWLGTIPPDEDLSASFRGGVYVSALIKVVANSVSTTNTTLAGIMCGFNALQIPALDQTLFIQLPPYRVNDYEYVEQVPAANGVLGIARPPTSVDIQDFESDGLYVQTPQGIANINGGDAWITTAAFDPTVPNQTVNLAAFNDPKIVHGVAPAPETGTGWDQLQAALPDNPVGRTQTTLNYSYEVMLTGMTGTAGMVELSYVIQLQTYRACSAASPGAGVGTAGGVGSLVTARDAYKSVNLYWDGTTPTFRFTDSVSITMPDLNFARLAGVQVQFTQVDVAVAPAGTRMTITPQVLGCGLVVTMQDRYVRGFFENAACVAFDQLNAQQSVQVSGTHNWSVQPTADLVRNVKAKLTPLSLDDVILGNRALSAFRLVVNAYSAGNILPPETTALAELASRSNVVTLSASLGDILGGVVGSLASRIPVVGSIAGPALGALAGAGADSLAKHFFGSGGRSHDAPGVDTVSAIVRKALRSELMELPTDDERAATAVRTGVTGEGGLDLSYGASPGFTIPTASRVAGGFSASGRGHADGPVFMCAGEDTLQSAEITVLTWLRGEAASIWPPVEAAATLLGEWLGCERKQLAAYTGAIHLLVDLARAHALSEGVVPPLEVGSGNVAGFCRALSGRYKGKELTSGTSGRVGAFLTVLSAIGPAPASAAYATIVHWSTTGCALPEHAAAGGDSDAVVRPKPAPWRGSVAHGACDGVPLSQPAAAVLDAFSKGGRMPTVAHALRDLCGEWLGVGADVDAVGPFLELVAQAISSDMVRGRTDVPAPRDLPLLAAFCSIISGVTIRGSDYDVDGPTRHFLAWLDATPPPSGAAYERVLAWLLHPIAEWTAEFSASDMDDEGSLEAEAEAFLERLAGGARALPETVLAERMVGPPRVVFAETDPAVDVAAITAAVNLAPYDASAPASSPNSPPFPVFGAVGAWQTAWAQGRAPDLFRCAYVPVVTRFPGQGPGVERMAITLSDRPMYRMVAGLGPSTLWAKREEVVYTNSVAAKTPPPGNRRVLIAYDTTFADTRVRGVAVTAADYIWRAFNYGYLHFAGAPPPVMFLTFHGPGLSNDVKVHGPSYGMAIRMLCLGMPPGPMISGTYSGIPAGDYGLKALYGAQIGPIALCDAPPAGADPDVPPEEPGAFALKLLSKGGGDVHKIVAPPEAILAGDSGRRPIALPKGEAQVSLHIRNMVAVGTVSMLGTYGHAQREAALAEVASGERTVPANAAEMAAVTDERADERFATVIRTNDARVRRAAPALSELLDNVAHRRLTGREAVGALLDQARELSRSPNQAVSNAAAGAVKFLTRDTAAEPFSLAKAASSLVAAALAIPQAKKGASSGISANARRALGALGGSGPAGVGGRIGPVLNTDINLDEV